MQPKFLLGVSASSHTTPPPSPKQVFTNRLTANNAAEAFIAQHTTPGTSHLDWKQDSLVGALRHCSGQPIGRGSNEWITVSVLRFDSDEQLQAYLRTREDFKNTRENAYTAYEHGEGNEEAIDDDPLMSIEDEILGKQGRARGISASGNLQKYIRVRRRTMESKNL